MNATIAHESHRPCFTELLVTQRRETPIVAQEKWAALVERSLATVATLAEALKEELRGGAPSNRTIDALYSRTLSLSQAHPHCVLGGSVQAKVFSATLDNACDTTAAWYLHSLGKPWEIIQRAKLDPSSYNFEARREAPTFEAVATLLAEIKTLQTLDLAEISKEFARRHNAGYKESQVFSTPI